MTLDKVHYHTYNKPPLDPITNSINPVHMKPLYLLTSQFNIISSLPPFSNGLLPFGLPNKTFYGLLIYPMNSIVLFDSMNHPSHPLLFHHTKKQ